MKPPDHYLYNPTFRPWESDIWSSADYSAGSDRSLVTKDRCYAILQLLLNSMSVNGSVVECGVYKGGTLKMIASLMRRFNNAKTLYAFDTFDGMPDVDEEKDDHHKGDFADTDLQSVVEYVGFERLTAIKGFIPESFSRVDCNSICFAHVDVDIYKSVVDCCEFIWPRLSVGGVIVFDDYGFSQCYGARLAADEFFSKRSVYPLVLETGQAIVHKTA